MIQREVLKFLRMLVGLFCYSCGICMAIHANIGLTPWDAFGMGIANLFGMTFGVSSTIISLILLFFTVGLLKEKFGFGTIFNALLIGTMVDVIERTGLLPYMEHFLPGLLMMLLGQFSICIGMILYIPTGMGAGPRDSLTVALSKRLPKVQIGVIRGSIEATVLLVGWLLGAKVGVGTVLAVFGIGSLLQFTCALFHCDLKSVVHENFWGTLGRWKREALAEKNA